VNPLDTKTCPSCVSDLSVPYWRDTGRLLNFVCKDPIVTGTEGPTFVGHHFNSNGSFGDYCKGCKVFFSLAIQESYENSIPNLESIVLPLFKQVFADFLLCKRKCESLFCLLHFQSFVEKVDHFCASTPEFKATLRFKTSLSVIYYAIHYEWLKCHPRHFVDEKRPGRSRESTISEVLSNWGG